MAIDYANQIANLIKELAPQSNLDIGNKFQATSIEITGDKVFLEFDVDNYTYLKSLITSVTNPNTQFTVSGFYLKNQILSFSAHPNESTFKYAFLAEFKLPHKLKKDQQIVLKGFTNTSYSIEYKVLRIVDAHFVVLYPLTTVSIIDVTSGLGYFPVQYTSGLNGIKTFADEGTNTLSYEIDEDDYLSTSTVDDVDQDFDIFVHDYNENIKVINFQTFVANLTDPTNTAYILVDTTSLRGTQNRSRSNQQDNNYNAYGRVGFFEKNYSINLIYLLERNSDDANNQTTSGSDIVDKQVSINDSLLSILRESLHDDVLDSKIFTSLTILSDYVLSNVLEGRVFIAYELGFSIFYNSDILLQKDDSGSYKIESLKINNDVVDFS